MTLRHTATHIRSVTGKHPVAERFAAGSVLGAGHASQGIYAVQAPGGRAKLVKFSPSDAQPPDAQSSACTAKRLAAANPEGSARASGNVERTDAERLETSQYSVFRG